MTLTRATAPGEPPGPDVAVRTARGKMHAGDYAGQVGATCRTQEAKDNDREQFWQPR